MFTIKTPQFEAGLSQRPGVEILRRRKEGTALLGNPAGEPNVWTLYDRETGEVLTVSDGDGAVDYACTPLANGLLWRCTLSLRGETVGADLRVEAQGDGLRFSWENFREGDRVVLVSLRLGGLAGISAEDKNARMALPSHGGRLIDPGRCGPGKTDHRYNWILDSFGSAAVLYTDRMTAVARIHRMDDQLTSQVSAGHTAQVGALLRHRYTVQDPSYRRANGRDPRNVEDAEALPIEQDFALPGAPFVTVELLAHEPVSPESGWVVGAKHVRDSLPGKPSDFYRGRMVYKIFVGMPSRPKATTLAQIRQIVFDFARRTGNAGQVPYLVGFQHRGHDTAYPDVFTLNPTLESIEALGKLFADARSVNCTLSFHDNFDDAYADSPSWCAEDISRDNSGHLLRGGVWNGAQAYWNSMPFYARHRAAERIRRTMETYPFLQDTYHLDVLTASVFRIDFRAGSPSGREADLAARREIAAMFREQGLDLTSEACGLPFVGDFSYFWHMQRVPRSLYPGDRRIPMVTFLAHGKADYAGTHTDTPRNILDGLLYGGFYCNDVTAETPMKELTDAYFMVQAPLDALRDDFAEDYFEAEGRKTVRYASGAEVTVDFESEECTVVIGGKTVIENGCAMLPQPDGSVVLYRAWEEPYEPVRWRTGLPAGTELVAVPMGVDLPQERLTVDADGAVPLELPMGVGYRVQMEGRAANADKEEKA